MSVTCSSWNLGLSLKKKSQPQNDYTDFFCKKKGQRIFYHYSWYCVSAIRWLPNKQKSEKRSFQKDLQSKTDFSVPYFLCKLLPSDPPFVK